MTPPPGMRNLVWLLFSAEALVLLAEHVNGIECRPQDAGNEEYVTIGAMCSDSNAAVRWSDLSEDKGFQFMRLEYTCTNVNGSVQYDQSSDTCFEKSPNLTAADTGVSSVGHELQTGVECTFSVKFRIKYKTDCIQVNCSIKSPEVCTASPDECQVDRVSVMNANEQCPSYHCATGYEGLLCNNVNECNYEPCDEHADCHDTDGSYFCKCHDGYMWGDENNCTDIDECLNETCTDENAHCVNTMGSFSCQCNPGFTGDGQNCSDINECPDACHEMASCTNTEGSFQCECLPGYTGDGHECSDLNECGQGNGPCDKNAHCKNTEGSYECQCYDGFQGNGYNCTDENECELTNRCDRDAECINTPGSYQCKCNTGYAGDGHKCSAVNCAKVGDRCYRDHASCTRDGDSYRCTCLHGFSEEDGDCKDIDECEEGSYICPDNTTCTNLPGTYKCDRNYTSIDSDNLVAVLSGGIIGGVALITLITTAVIAAYIYIQCLKTDYKELMSQELTKMDLDPFYTPSFWNGSLTSIHSTYERLVFKTDIGRSYTCDEPTHSEHSEDQVSISTVDQVSALVSPPIPTQRESHVHLQSTAYHQAGEHLNSVQIHGWSNTNPIPSMSSDAISISGILATLEDNTSPNREKYLPDSITNHQGSTSYNIRDTASTASSAYKTGGISPEMYTVTGELQGNRNLPQTIGSGTKHIFKEEACNGGYITESEASRQQELLNSTPPVDSTKDYASNSEDITEEVKHRPRAISVVSSGYATESARSPSEGYGRCNSWGSNTFEHDSPLEEKPTIADSISSGYETRIIIEDLEKNFRYCRAYNSTGQHMKEFTTTCTQKVPLSELGEEELDCVKFTVNAKQQYEYVNALEEHFFADISFEAAP